MTEKKNFLSRYFERTSVWMSGSFWQWGILLEQNWGFFALIMNFWWFLLLEVFLNMMLEKKACVIKKIMSNLVKTEISRFFQFVLDFLGFLIFGFIYCLTSDSPHLFSASTYLAFLPFVFSNCLSCFGGLGPLTQPTCFDNV